MPSHDQSAVAHDHLPFFCDTGRNSGAARFFSCSICGAGQACNLLFVSWRDWSIAKARCSIARRGEPAQYLLIQLFMYRERLRVAPAMNDVMKGASDDDLRALSEAITRLPPPQPPSELGDSQRLARGGNLSEQNHCNVCHRTDFSGQENVPRLADQREDYLLKSLQDYKSGARHGYDATMAEVLQPINESDLTVLAYFLAHAR
jgi:cytochrome c553